MSFGRFIKLPAFLGVLNKARATAYHAFSSLLRDGFMHAGNLAYLSLLTLFPFLIVTAALARLLGNNEDTQRTVSGLLFALPPQVAHIIERPIQDVLHVRTGGLLWLGAAVGLWTVAGFIETIRDIMRRAYNTVSERPFWEYRLRSIAFLIVAILFMMLGFSAQIFIAAAEQFVFRLFPLAHNLATWLRISHIFPVFVIFSSIYLLLLRLTPRINPSHKKIIWPGALLVALWWLGVVQLLPMVLGWLHGYTLTYGGLAGVIITLFFFWLVGLGLVAGIHFNAALAHPPYNALKASPTNNLASNK